MIRITRDFTQEKIDGLPVVIVSMNQIKRGIRFSEIAVKMGFAASVSEGKRAIDGGCMFVNDFPVRCDWKVRRFWLLRANPLVLTVGKKRHGVIKLDEWRGT